MDKKELSVYLEQFVTPQRIARFREVLSNRTGHIRVVLENLYQAHNASAVLRSCDCFGIQHVHFIENSNTLRISDEVAMGSSSWLNIHRHNGKGVQNSTSALESLKSQGYRIVATSPHKGAYTPLTLPVEKKFALVFGTEMQGISREVLDLADDYLSVPMVGFTESFNISVCAALCMYDLSRRVRTSVRAWQLDTTEQEDVYLSWLKASIDHSEAIISDYLKKKKI